MMMYGDTADELYINAWWQMPNIWQQEGSRNGMVYTVPYPTILTLHNPLARVVFNPVRDANPFFHLAEVVWMFAGSNDVRFVEQFNKRYREYADEETDIVWGAYGSRWQNKHRGARGDQIQEVINILHSDPQSRQAVISMWDPYADLGTGHNDRPCNTQIMFRVVNDKLDMLVTNRSNDLVWGALGANVVHFTYLQEVIAQQIGVPLGTYRVVTNNLHFYPNMPRGEEHMKNSVFFDPELYPPTIPVLAEGEAWADLKADCRDYVMNAPSERTKWFTELAEPMMTAYLNKKYRQDIILELPDCDWKKAALDWMGRRSTPRQ